jgi:hypothetical protein
MIYIIGNSHINNFSGDTKLNYGGPPLDPKFEFYYLGATIAYNFFEHHYPKSLQFLKNKDPQTSYVTYVVGEVDCRFHIPLQFEKQKRPVEDLVKECIDRFFRCYIDLKEKGYKVFHTSTHPTTLSPPSTNAEQPIYGDWRLRNGICVIWNNYCKELCSKHDIPFVDYYGHLIDNENKTKTEYFLDYCHLNSSKVIGFINDELRKNKIIP